MAWKPGSNFRKQKITLKGAKYDDGVFDIDIPIDADGTMLINWPHKTFGDSFKHCSIYDLINYSNSITAMAATISSEQRDSWKIFSDNPVSILREDKEYVDYL